MEKKSKVGTLPCKWKEGAGGVYTNSPKVKECGKPSIVYETDVNDTLLSECPAGHATELSGTVWKPEL
jgi:hypothetical protein